MLETARFHSSMVSVQTRSLLAGILLPLATTGCNSSPRGDSVDTTMVERDVATVQLREETPNFLERTDVAAMPTLHYVPIIPKASLVYDTGLIDVHVGEVALYLHTQRGRNFLIANVQAKDDSSPDLSVFFQVERSETARGYELHFNAEGREAAVLRIHSDMNIKFSVQPVAAHALDTLTMAVRGQNAEDQFLRVQFPTKDLAIIEDGSGNSVRVHWTCAFGLGPELEGRQP